jgi:formamidopyrimidine-DNA glycosylase
MPELPEVETVMRGLAPVMTGVRITAVRQNRADLRFPLPAMMPERLTGRRIECLGRRAKYILIHLDGGETLIVHLGMTGRFTIASPSGTSRIAAEASSREASGDGRHDHVVLTLANGARVTFNDARRFGYMDLIPRADLDRHKLFRDLGPEPMSDALTADHLAMAGKNRRTDLKAFLMDQRTVAGLGNIYVCEALYRARLKPTRSAESLVGKVGRRRADALIAAIKSVLGDAIAAGGSSLRDYVQATGELGYFQKAHAVYDREDLPCLTPDCKGAIRRLMQGGRSTFFCARCQR